MIIYQFCTLILNFSIRACSQKLAAWQESAELGLERLKLTRANTVRGSKKSKDAKGGKFKEIKPDIKTVTINVENQALAGQKIRKKPK